MNCKIVKELSSFTFAFLDTLIRQIHTWLEVEKIIRENKFCNTNSEFFSNITFTDKEIRQTMYHYFPRNNEKMWGRLSKCNNLEWKNEKKWTT